jgi:hypothetical protein
MKPVHIYIAAALTCFLVLLVVLAVVRDRSMSASKAAAIIDRQQIAAAMLKLELEQARRTNSLPVGTNNASEK